MIVEYQINARITVIITENVLMEYANAILVGKEMTVLNKSARMIVVIMENARIGDVNVMKAMRELIAV
jgi:hypothetical protein